MEHFSIFRKAMQIVGFTLISITALAVPEWKAGTLQQIYTDPSDVVLVLNVLGPCGTNMYHIILSNQNFKEMYAAMLLALSSGRTVNLYVTSCADQRNILSHGGVMQ